MENQEQSTTIRRIIEQPTTEVYWGYNGHLVIKQRDEYLSDEIIVLITPENIGNLINILTSFLGEYNEQ